MIQLTHKLVAAGKSLNGGYSRAQVALLGVEWPLRSGWKDRLRGRWVEDEVYAEFVRLKDRHLLPEGQHTRD